MELQELRLHRRLYLQRQARREGGERLNRPYRGAPRSATGSRLQDREYRRYLLALPPGSDGEPGNDHDSATAVLPDALCHPPPPTRHRQPRRSRRQPESVKRTRRAAGTCDYEIGDQERGSGSCWTDHDPGGGTGRSRGHARLRVRPSRPTRASRNLHLRNRDRECGAAWFLAGQRGPPPSAGQLRRVRQCKVPNTAKIVTPAGGSNENDDDTDDKATAIAKIDKVRPESRSAADCCAWVIPCDPPALQIEKVADPQVCTKAPGGFECSYDVKVTSVGKDPYHGTLESTRSSPWAPR